MATKTLVFVFVCNHYKLVVQKMIVFPYNSMGFRGTNKKVPPQLPGLDGNVVGVYFFAEYRLVEIAFSERPQAELYRSSAIESQAERPSRLCYARPAAGTHNKPKLYCASWT